MKLHSKPNESLYNFVQRTIKNVEVNNISHEIFREEGSTVVNVGDTVEKVLKDLKLSICLARLAKIS